MSLKKLLDKGILKEHVTNSKEIYDLFSIADRDLEDASLKDLSSDGKFNFLYNAVLQVTTALLYCEGYRIGNYGHHTNSFLFLRDYDKGQFKDIAAYFDQCRMKRNLTHYDYAGSVSETECKLLFDQAINFIKTIKKILIKKYSKYYTG